MRTAWSFRSAGQLIFGWNAVRQIGPLARKNSWQRILLITDPTLVSAGVVEGVDATLQDADSVVACFDGSCAEPPIEIAEQAIALGREFRPQAVVGLGGGSNMDLAKVTALVLTHGGQPADYFGFDRVPGPLLPLICVPTTAGTGSEVSHAAVLTDSANAIKVSTLSHYLRPTLAVVDPQLTMTCPSRVTADSGIDALTHAIEGMTATDFDKISDDNAYEGRHPLGQLLAERAIGLIAQHLPTAVADGQNRDARESMALAATLAGLAFSNCGVALVHALEYPLGGAVHCSHGAGNGLLLPYVMRFNLPERIEMFARIAGLLGVDTAGMSDTEAAEASIEAVIQLRRVIGIPDRIRELGECESQLPEFARKAFAIKRLMDVNPRRPTENDLLGILQTAY
jgi:alcohol dehydrogenase class IV